jgi:hypothetical protein
MDQAEAAVELGGSYSKQLCEPTSQAEELLSALHRIVAMSIFGAIHHYPVGAQAPDRSIFLSRRREADFVSSTTSVPPFPPAPCMKNTEHLSTPLRHPLPIWRGGLWSPRARRCLTAPNLSSSRFNLPEGLLSMTNNPRRFAPIDPNPQVGGRQSLDVVDHMAFVVRNIATAVTWCSQRFNFKVIYQDETFALLEFQNVAISFVVRKQHPRHVAIIRADAERFGKLITHRDGSRSCYVRGLSHNIVEVQLPREAT